MIKKLKRWITHISVAFMAIICACGTACGDAKDGGELSAPENVRIENRVLYWDEVENADYYVVSASNGKRYETTECQCLLIDFQKSGNYEFKVFAKSYDEKYEGSTSGKVTQYLPAPLAEGEDKYHFKYKWVEELSGYEVSIGNAILQEELILPDYFQGFPVKKIADAGFTFSTFFAVFETISPNVRWYDEESGCNTIIKTLRLPQCVEVIGFGAFCGLTEIEEVVLPEGVAEIQDYAFDSCAKLKKVNFPNGLKTIGEGAFSDTALETIDLPNTVTSIGAEAFACPTYQTPNIPENNERVKQYHLDSALSRVVIPNMIKKIERRTLCGRENLTTIVFQGVEYTYSATQPTVEGNFWRYDGAGSVVFWE